MTRSMSNFFDAYPLEPSASDRTALQRRRQRLTMMAESVENAVGAFDRACAGSGRRASSVRIRDEFIYQATPAPAGRSDRAVPARTERPPATSIANSRGSALRLELVALALAQANSRAGARSQNVLPLR